MIKVRKGDIVELRINKMAYGGQGVARLDGLVIFVKGGIPGDTVTARVFRKRKGYAEAEIIELVDPSPD
ncbi:MAG: TRAM domain-containing protein, partial [Desulfobacteraceae bacterium]|nr:TRAM domain-containing protein [Desulfobacteraceae bacterium]